MPKRLSKDSRPSDINQAAYQMVRRSTQEQPDSTKPSSSELSRIASMLGRRGGKIGGKRRLVTMTAAERREVAVKAAKTRWANHVKKHS
jgi:hypothetical protein